jgi:predicted dithiol-disulfide oxidoreductase (DUF899 family)
MLVALGVMSVTWMSVIAVVGLAPRLLPARAAIDVAHDELTRRSDELARWRRAAAGGPQGESARRFRGGVGTDLATYTRAAPGMSAFALEDGAVYHTYSAYTRGLDGLWGMYQWLDRAPRGGNETALVRGFGGLRAGVWYRRHDEYDSE